MGHLKSLELPEPGTRGESAGTSAKSRWWLWLLIALAIAGAAWYYHSRSGGDAANSAAGAPGGAAAGAGAKGKGGPGGGNFAVPVVVATAQRGDLPVYYSGLGTVTAFNTVTVHSRVDGQLVSVAFKEGQFVHQGEILAQIDPRQYQVALSQAEGQLAKDQAQRKDAETNLERYKLLFAEGVIAKQQLDTQQSQVGQSEGALKSDQAAIDSAKLQLSYSRITAPISGRVGLRLVDAGNMVHASDPGGLAVITQLQPISVIFSLPQDQLPEVVTKLHANKQLTVDAFDRDNTDKIASGTLATIDNTIDVTTGTYKLKSKFSNEDNALFPNQFVNVHLLVDTKRDLTVVPVAAIQRGPQGTYVYAVDSTNTVKIRPVTIAQTSNESAGLSDGLNAGDVVVIDGQDKLDDGKKVIPNSAANRNGGHAPSSQPGGKSATPGAESPVPGAHPGDPASSPSGKPNGTPNRQRPGTPR